MKKTGLVLLIVLGLVLVVAGWGISKYNTLVRENENIDGLWAQ